MKFLLAMFIFIAILEAVVIVMYAVEKSKNKIEQAFHDELADEMINNQKKLIDAQTEVIEKQEKIISKQKDIILKQHNIMAQLAEDRMKWAARCINGVRGVNVIEEDPFKDW